MTDSSNRVTRVTDRLVVEEVVSHLGRAHCEQGFGERDVEQAYERLRFRHHVSPWSLSRLSVRRVDRLVQAVADFLAEHPAS